MDKFQVRTTRRIRVNGDEVPSGTVVEVPGGVALDLVNGNSGVLLSLADGVRLHQWAASKARAAAMLPTFSGSTH
jgi:hypothetical protein